MGWLSFRRQKMRGRHSHSASLSVSTPCVRLLSLLEPALRGQAAAGRFAASRPRTGYSPADGLLARGRATRPRTGYSPADGLLARGRANSPADGLTRPRTGYLVLASLGLIFSGFAGRWGGRSPSSTLPTPGR